MWCAAARWIVPQHALLIGQEFTFGPILLFHVAEFHEISICVPRAAVNTSMLA